jgi:hypothetical protein
MGSGKYALFFALLHSLTGYKKEDAIYDFTDERTTHLGELTKEEYGGLCNYLQGIVNLDATRRRAGSRVLNLLTEMGFKTTRKEFWTEIDRFLCDKRIAGKRYRDLSAEEHEQLIPKLRALKNKGYRANGEITEL